MNAIDLLAHMDVIERVDALVHFLRGQKAWRFAMLRFGGWAGIQAERILKQYGIPIWDRDFSDDFLFFVVPIQQANWAEYLLLRAGVPLVGFRYNPNNYVTALKHGGTMPRPWSARR